MASVQALKDVQASQGATFTMVGTRAVAMEFGLGMEESIAAVKSGVVLCDRSHWGRIEVADGDRLRFLHNQSTNDFMAMQPGQGGETVFVTSTARTLDLVSAFVQTDSVLLLTHPSCRESLLKWMDRFIFFADKVKLTDRTEETVTFSLLGPQSSELLTRLGVTTLPTMDHHHQQVTIRGIDLLLACGSGLALPGYTLIAPTEFGADLWQILSLGSDEGGAAVPLGETAWNYLRIYQGRPVPGAELTEEFNPLEAGLWHTISFDKGCYIGQETITRLDTYKGVKQQLWGIELPIEAIGDVAAGTPLMLEGKKVGVLTSILGTNSLNTNGSSASERPERGKQVRGLAYVKTKAGGIGLEVEIGGVKATIVDVPFLTRSRQDVSDSPG